MSSDGISSERRFCLRRPSCCRRHCRSGGGELPSLSPSTGRAASSRAALSRAIDSRHAKTHVQGLHSGRRVTSSRGRRGLVRHAWTRSRGRPELPVCASRPTGPTPATLLLDPAQLNCPTRSLRSPSQLSQDVLLPHGFFFSLLLLTSLRPQCTWFEDSHKGRKKSTGCWNDIRIRNSACNSYVAG